MSPTALADVFREVTVTQPAQAAGVDARGNPVTASAGAAITCYLKPSRSPQLAERYGASSEDVLLTGRTVNPATLPAGVNVGWEVPLAWMGVAGKATLVHASLPLLDELVPELGTMVVFRWTRGAA